MSEIDASSDIGSNIGGKGNLKININNELSHCS